MQIPLELVEAEHACSNKYIKYRHVIFGLVFTKGSYLTKGKKERNRERERDKERNKQTKK